MLSRLAIGFALLSFLALPYALELSFSDIAASSGLRLPNTYGGRTHKEYILETTGNGAAIFDYDGDGFNDIFIANGATLEGQPRATHPQLYRNNGTGHFTEVSEQAGLTHEGWGQGVCIGDYDNDGHPDLLVTYYGHNVLYRNLGNKTYAKLFRAGVIFQGENPVLKVNDKPIKKTELKPEEYSEWVYCHSDGKRDGKAGRVYRLFPKFDNWEVDFELNVIEPRLTQDVVVRHLVAAGLYNGMGRFRPQNGGHLGRFDVYVDGELQTADVDVGAADEVEEE